jgi:hypothetical protein
MVKKKEEIGHVSNKGFGLALFFTFLTLFSFYYGIKDSNLLYLSAVLVLGSMGLYWVKKSWKSYSNVKKKASKKKK